MQNDYEEPAFDVHLCLNLIGNMLTYAFVIIPFDQLGV